MKIPTLSIDLYDRLYEVLLSCEEFDSNTRVPAIVAAHEELARHNGWFLSHEYETKEERLKSTLTYLVRQRCFKGTEPALPLFLMTLYSTLVEGDPLRDELEKLHEEVELELVAQLKPHKSASLPPPTPPNSQIGDPATAAFMPPNEAHENPLDRADRAWIIQVVQTIIEPMSPAGRKNLLRGSLSDTVINTIEIDKASGIVAETIIYLLEGRDKLHAENHCLELFLHTLIADGYCEEPVKKRIKDLLTLYNQVRNSIEQEHSIRNGNPVLEQDFFIEEPSRATLKSPEEQAIAKQYKAARRQYRTTPQSSRYKIDAGAIIQCNLTRQKIDFWKGIDDRYKGMFIFALANIDRSILKEYVIESLVWDFKQRIKRPMHPVRHIHLAPEYLDFSSTEQGVISIQKQLQDQQQLSVQAINDLLTDNQGTNLVIVIWHKDIPPDRFKHIALSFSERLKGQVADTLQQQSRCLVLFWANYGPPPIEPLEVPTMLPVFEQFEVKHLTEWLEYEVSNQLRGQNVPDQEIRYCWERLVEKITYFNGSLPETYEILRDSLELGGVI